MTATVAPRFGVSYGYTSGEAGWGPAVNYNFRAMDALLCAFLVSDTATSPPAAPQNGDAYFIPATGATGVWIPNAGKIAVWQGGVWNYYPVPTGFRARIVDRGSFYFYSGATWVEEFPRAQPSSVTSVAGRTGAVLLLPADIPGLAPLDSPALVGTPTVPTAVVTTSTTQAASTAFVQARIAALINAAPAALDTLAEIAAQLASDESAVAALVTQIAAKVTSVAGRGGVVTLLPADVPGVASLDVNGFVPWQQLKPQLQTVPLAFIISGKPTANQTYNLMLGLGITIPANFANSKVYDSVLPTSSAVFTLNRVSATTVTFLGTLTILNTGRTAVTLSTQAAISMIEGEILQLVAPAIPDATLADIGITISAQRV